MLLMLLSITTACKTDEKNELFLVPHFISNKVYGYETAVTLSLISHESISSIDEFTANIFNHLYSQYDSYELYHFTELEEYEGYYVYLITFNIYGIEGEVEVSSIQFTTNDMIYSFDTRVFLSSETTKEIHFYSGIDTADFMWPAYKYYGLDFILETSEDVTINNIRFENIFDFDLNEYVDGIYLNELPFNQNFDLLADEAFSLSISFKDSTPENTYLIDQLIIDYLDADNNQKFAYVLVPLYLGSYEIIAENLIDEMNS